MAGPGTSRTVSSDTRDSWGPSHIPFDQDTLDDWRRMDEPLPDRTLVGEDYEEKAQASR